MSLSPGRRIFERIIGGFLSGRVSLGSLSNAFSNHNRAAANAEAAVEEPLEHASEYEADNDGEDGAELSTEEDYANMPEIAPGTDEEDNMIIDEIQDDDFDDDEKDGSYCCFQLCVPCPMTQ